jgi:hypothetical protein
LSRLLSLFPPHRVPGSCTVPVPACLFPSRQDPARYLQQESKHPWSSFLPVSYLALPCAWTSQRLRLHLLLLTLPSHPPSPSHLFRCLFTTPNQPSPTFLSFVLVSFCFISTLAQRSWDLQLSLLSLAVCSFPESKGSNSRYPVPPAHRSRPSHSLQQPLYNQSAT